MNIQDNEYYDMLEICLLWRDPAPRWIGEKVAHYRDYVIIWHHPTNMVVLPSDWQDIGKWNWAFDSIHRSKFRLEAHSIRESLMFIDSRYE